MKFIKTVIAWVSWLQLFLVPSFIGSGIGFAVYKFIGNFLGIILGLSIFLIGLALGFYWAEKIRQKEGTSNFLSKINASPDVP